MGRSMESKAGQKVGRKVNRLRAIELDRLPVGFHADGNGLYLQVTSKGARSWVFRYRAGSRLRDLGLGALRLVPLAVARAKALDAARLRLDGIDPIDAKRARVVAANAEAARAVTFWQCVEDYIEKNKAGWKNAKHADQWRSTLETYARPTAGHLAVSAIDTETVRAIIEPIWETKPETAGRLRGRIEAVLDFAKVRGQRDGENPARWRGHLDQVLPARSKVAKVRHHAALDWRQAPGFFADLSNQNGFAADALRFTILTAARTGEVLGATWDEVDAENAVWTIPAGRMKAEKEHRVVLNAPALAILERMREVTSGKGFIFPGHKAEKSLSDMSMLAVFKRMKRTDLTTHGFRSTFKDWASESTAFPVDAVELALAHTVGSKVEQAYRRRDMLEKRRDLARAWGDFLTGSERSSPPHVADT